MIDSLPFVKQEYQYCGPSALASVLGYYGEQLSQHEIAGSVYTEELNGSLITDMRSYVQNLGYDAEIINGDLSTLKTYIDENIPVIVLVDRGVSVVSFQHYYVVYGYVKNREYFIINDGSERKRFIGNNKLDDQWKKMNRLMLVVRDDKK